MPDNTNNSDSQNQEAQQAQENQATQMTKKTQSPLSQKPVVFLGADHGGFVLKEKSKAWLQEWGYKTEDMGAFQLDPTDDYPPFAIKVAKAVAELNSQGETAIGVLYCRSGAGMSIAANKTDGIRAVNASTMHMVEHAREHDDANILCLQGDWLEPAQARHLLLAFLNTNFSGSERHLRRLAQISHFEKTGKIS